MTLPVLKKQLFQKFQEDYSEYMIKYQTNQDFSTEAKFLDFINVYILLNCYITAYNQSNVSYGPFDTSSWWFFDNQSFKNILEDFDIDAIMKKYNSDPSPIISVSPATDERLVSAEVSSLLTEMVSKVSAGEALKL